jgi:hypothetical protein
MTDTESKSKKRSNKPFSELFDELVNLVKGYVKQETVAPITALGRYVRFGIVGVVALAIGTLMLAIGLLRMLQYETAPHFDGSLTFVLYIPSAIFAVLVMGLAVIAITKVGK